MNLNDQKIKNIIFLPALVFATIRLLNLIITIPGGEIWDYIWFITIIYAFYILDKNNKAHDYARFNMYLLGAFFGIEFITNLLLTIPSISYNLTTIVSTIIISIGYILATIKFYQRHF